jgi:hypothetical protein
MHGFVLVAIAVGVPASLAYWAYSRWQARVVFRKLSGKGKKARKKALKRLSKEERLVYDRHGLRMLKMLAIAFGVGSIGALVVGEIHLEADLMLFYWSGDVTWAEHPVGFTILWLILSAFPVGLWAFYFHERRALEQRAIKTATRGGAGSSASA